MRENAISVLVIERGKVGKRFDCFWGKQEGKFSWELPGSFSSRYFLFLLVAIAVCVGGRFGGKIGTGRTCLENRTFTFVFHRYDGAKDGPDRLIKDGLEALLRESGAFQVFHRTDLLGHGQPLGIGNGRQLFVAQLIDRVFVVPQIELCPDQDYRYVRTVVAHLRVPFGPDVFERGRIDQREAYEKHVRLGVGQRPQTVVIFLPSRIPQAQIDWLTVDHHVGRVVVEHGRNVLAWEGIGCVADQQTGFTHGTVTDHDALDGLHFRALPPTTFALLWQLPKQPTGSIAVPFQLEFS